MSSLSKEVPSVPARIALDVGILVEDIERSLGFYRDLIGLPVVGEVMTSLIGKGRMVQLKYGESLIKLVELETPPPNANPEGLSTALGIRYITLLVADIEGVMGRLERAYTPISVPLTRLGHGAIISMVEDPDGNTVEFVQEDLGFRG